MSENGEKKMEAIKKINANFRGENLMPEQRAVNDPPAHGKLAHGTPPPK